MRGPGEPQTIFAMESHMDLIARELGMDPAELRLKNVIRDGTRNGLGEEYHHLRGAATIEAALEASGWWDPKPPNVGRGIAIGERAPGGGQTHAHVVFQEDGTVVVYTSIFEQGSGTYTTIRQMVAEVLGVPVHRVQARVWDTDGSGFDSGAGASRFTRMASEAAYQAAVNARDALSTAAEATLGWPKASVTLEGDLLWNQATGESVPVAGVLRDADGAVRGEGHYNDMGHAHVTAFTVQVAEVEVDPETGQVRLQRFTSVHDAGRVLNPQGHDGQIRGGVMQGIGYALMEELPVDDGRVQALSFADYKVPTAADAPPMQAIAIESESGVGPFNVKGIGENPVSPVAPAIANAIEAAVGVRLRDLPLSAEKVYRALRRTVAPK